MRATAACQVKDKFVYSKDIVENDEESLKCATATRRRSTRLRIKTKWKWWSLVWCRCILVSVRRLSKPKRVWEGSERQEKLWKCVLKKLSVTKAIRSDEVNDIWVSEDTMKVANEDFKEAKAVKRQLT